MAFSPINLAIQEILQTDFITDLAQIHNSNVLILKDKLEDLMNTFEMDINTISIGVDNPINNINTQNVIIQDGGFIFQTGIPNQIIAKLEKNGNDESVLNVDHLNIDLITSMNDLSVNTATVNTSLTSAGPATFTNTLKYDSSIVESKETVSVPVAHNIVTNEAEGRITLTNTSKRNIYVNLNCVTAIGPTQVYDVPTATLNASTIDFSLYIDFDANNPPAQNTTFTIYLVDVLEDSTAGSIAAAINLAGLELKFKPGVNAAASNAPIILHNDFVGNNLFLGIRSTNSNVLAQAITNNGANATFNYIVDQNTNDRLLITSMVGMEVYN